MNIAVLAVTGWRMLRHGGRRLLLSCLSIAFSVVIMFMQMGFFNGLNDSQANLAKILSADLVMTSIHKKNLNSTDRFSLKRLRQALGVAGVKSETWLYTDPTYWWNPQNGSRQRVQVIAVDPDNPGLALPALDRYRQELKRPNAVLFDRLSRSELGTVRIGTSTTVGNDRVETVGLFNLGANFSYEGNVITSFATYYRIFSFRDPAHLSDDISLGLLTLKSGADLEQVRRRILSRLPHDISLHTPAELVAREKAYTTRATPVGTIFGIGLVVALVIGVIVCYQLLFNEIHDHIPQFATLKAIGYRAHHLYGIVLTEALLLSLLGFIPGLLASAWLYGAIQRISQIVMYLTPGRVLFILALTVIMALVSAALAMRQVVAADPADLY